MLEKWSKMMQEEGQRGEFTEIFIYIFFKVFADNSVDVELCQTLGVVGLKESTV